MARFFVDEKNDSNMIYKAKVIANAYNPVLQDEKVLSSTLDGGYKCECKVINYYYNISGITMIISKKCDNAKFKESYDLQIIDGSNTTFDTKTGFSVYGTWDDIFTNAFREARKQIEAINLIDRFIEEENNSKESNQKVKGLKKEN